MTDFELHAMYHNPETKQTAMAYAVNTMDRYVNSRLHTYYPNLNHTYVQDVFQECRLAVLHALSSYDPHRGATFLTWCRLPIQHAMRDYIDRMGNNDSTYNIKKYGRTNVLEINNNYANDRCKDLSDQITDIETHEAITKALEQLTPRQRYIIVQYYYVGEKPRNIASVLGIKVSSVADARRCAVRKLRTLLINDIAI